MLCVAAKAHGFVCGDIYVEFLEGSMAVVAGKCVGFFLRPLFAATLDFMLAILARLTTRWVALTSPGQL